MAPGVSQCRAKCVDLGPTSLLWSGTVTVDFSLSPSHGVLTSFSTGNADMPVPLRVPSTQFNTFILCSPHEFSTSGKRPLFLL